MFEVKDHILSNTDSFREAALHFKEFGTYTKHVASSNPNSSYYKFWKEETRRCLYGYSIGSDFITGYHYFYLNYSPILLVEKTGETKNGRSQGIRIEDFPKVWDSDYQYFHYLEESENNGQHSVILKTRGRGYSFKGGSMLNRNFYLIPQSRSYALASEKEYLTNDGILTKAWNMMDFIDANTPWAKRRQVKNQDMHKRASYIENYKGINIEKGFKSEIIGVSLKDNADKARGKRAKLILWEEAGKFPGLLKAWQVARPSVEQDGVTYGLMVAYGTGGTEGANFEALEELFYQPKGYNIHPVTNIWDENRQNKPCGLFIPQYMNMEGYYDKDGNSNKQAARLAEEEEREKVKLNTKNRESILRYIAEKPFTPQEAVMRIKGNIFPIKDLQEVLGELESNNKGENLMFIGDLHQKEDGSIYWKLNPNNKPIIDFPIKQSSDTEGSIIIWEHPYTTNENEIPYGMYIAGIDPYDHDKSSTGSLGSTIIYNKVTKRIVAEYTARPNTAKQYYENVHKLLKYYKATALYENEKKGLFDYFEEKNSLYLLADEPRLIKDIVQKSTVSRKKGVHMPIEVKEYIEELIKQWLLEENEKGLNLHKIRSIPLLKELIAYNDEGNFDRVIALGLTLLYSQEIRRHKPDSKDAKFTVLESKLFNNVKLKGNNNSMFKL